MEVEFRLGKDSVCVEPLLVPILESSDPNVAKQPITGYNVIEEVWGVEAMQHSKSETIQKVCRAFSVTFKTAQSMLKVIQTSDSDGDVGIVFTGKRRIS